MRPASPLVRPELKRSFHDRRPDRGTGDHLLTGRTLLAAGLAAALALLPSATLEAQEAGGRTTDRRAPDGSPHPNRTFEARRAPDGIRVDGRLDEPAWSAADAIPLPWETSPGDNDPARVDTECYLLFDPERLYFGCRAEDPDPDGIRAFITDRDDTAGHDRITLSLDPFDDARRAFEFSVSALGVQGDAVYDEQSGAADDSWDAIWSSAGRITADGYEIELAIPFRSLRFPDGDGARSWGFHARRSRPRSERVELRSMRLDRGNGCTLCQANELTGIRGVSSGLNLELTPTLTARRADERDGPDGRLAAGPIEPEAGLDVRWGVTSDLTLNLTANPDFSQVEADAPQVDVNRRFALFFPEKRPFFLEGADFFATPLQAVFTRTVADPIGGAKGTGKLGGQAVGAMLTLDRVNNLLFPGSQASSTASLDDEVAAAVLRFRRDVGASGTLGALYTGRLATGYGNHVGGADVSLRPLAPLGIRAQWLHSRTRYPDPVASANGQPEDAFGGDAAALYASYRTREWQFTGRASLLSPGFRADAGFIPQVDSKRFEAWGGRDVWPDGFFTRVGVSAGGWHFEDWRGTLDDQGVWIWAGFDGPWQSSYWVNPNWSRQRYGGETFRLFQLWTGGSLRPSGGLGLTLVSVVGTGVDFRNVRRGRQLRVDPAVDIRAGRRVRLELSGSYQRMDVDEGAVFTALVSQLRAVYNLSPRAFVRGVLQYRGTRRNPDTNPDLDLRATRGLATQLLFSYKVNPLTVLFLGYSDDRRGEDPLEGAPIGLTRTGRAFFVKLGYAWRP